jgi:hypothetical protein
MGAEKMPGRRFGVPAGRTERTERMVRTVYPDGTTVDSEPAEVAKGAGMAWAGLAGIFAKAGAPEGTRRKTFTRTVIVEASPWVEVVLPDAEEPAGEDAAVGS